MSKPAGNEIWLLKATPADPAKRQFLMGEDCVIFSSKADAEQYIAQSRLNMTANGVTAIEPVCVSL